MSTLVRETLQAAQKLLKNDGNEIVRLLTEADACAVRAVVHFELGQHEQAKTQLTKGCDLEYDALGDCEALGGLSAALYPDAEDI